MYFKACFIDSIVEHPIIEDIEISNLTGMEIIRFNNYEFEIVRNGDDEIGEITYSSQCIVTHGIEVEFLKLISYLLGKDQTVKLFNSNGLIEFLNWDDIDNLGLVKFSKTEC